MKVLIIDPWGVKSTSHYTNGISSGLAKKCQLTLATNYYYESTTNAEYEINRLFFKESELMESGLKRTIIRGLEYIEAYRKIISIVKKSNYDVIEIEWLLSYKLDILFIKILKKYAKVFYKAHNVIPHEHGERKIKDLKKIYSCVDYIILHGNAIKEEFQLIFPHISSEKIIIQRHGTYINKKTSYDLEKIKPEIIESVKNYERIYIFFGSIFYNKGVDRLIHVWREAKINNALLVIAGKVVSDYNEIWKNMNEIKNTKNLLLINEYVDNNTLNYLIEKSNAVFITYRHASMSGVVFTAAEFNKVILCTDTGSMKEYFVHGENGFLCDNDEAAILKMIRHINELSDEKLRDMGKKLNSYITENFSWENIGDVLYKEFNVALQKS